MPDARTPTSRWPQVVFIASTLVAAWLGMQAVHETGHVFGAWFSGATVEQIVLHPLTISRTDVTENVHPLIVIWAGPLCGVLLPVLAWAVAAWRKCGCAFWLRFFAGFCLIANGCYISMGLVDPIGDAQDLLRHGSPAWQLGTFGLLTAPVGLCLWHRQGRHFGLGPAAAPVTPRAAGIAFLATAALFSFGLWVGR